MLGRSMRASRSRTSAAAAAWDVRAARIERLSLVTGPGSDTCDCVGGGPDAWDDVFDAFDAQSLVSVRIAIFAVLDGAQG